MGCTNSQDQANKVENPVLHKKLEMIKGKIEKSSDFKLGGGDMVIENTSKIIKEYNILSPSLGKGAYGEVRKAIHRETNMIRAIKFIYKETTKKEDIDRMIQEVMILKSLVFSGVI